MIYSIDVKTTGEAVKVKSALIARYPAAKVDVVPQCSERTVKLWTVDCTFDARRRVLRDVHALLDELEPAPSQLRFNFYHRDAV